MISLNAQRLTVRQSPIASKAANITPSLQQSNLLPAYPQSIAFGMTIGNPNLPPPVKPLSELNKEINLYSFNFGDEFVNTPKRVYNTQGHITSTNNIIAKGLHTVIHNKHETTFVHNYIPDPSQTHYVEGRGKGNMYCGDVPKYSTDPGDIILNNATISDGISSEDGKIEIKGTVNAGYIETTQGDKFSEYKYGITINNGNIKEGIKTKSGHISINGTINAKRIEAIGDISKVTINSGQVDERIYSKGYIGIIGKLITKNIEAVKNVNMYEGSDVTAIETIKGDNIISEGKLAAEALSAENDIELQNATIINQISAGMNLTIDGTVQAGSINGHNISINGNASAKSLSAGYNINSTGELTAKSLSAGNDITLNKVNNLEEIHFERPDCMPTDRILTLKDKSIQHPKDGERIKIYIGEIKSLTIKSEMAEDEVKNKFEFIYQPYKRDEENNIFPDEEGKRVLDDDDDDMKFVHFKGLEI